MKSYRVSVNGKTYEVIVEETSNTGMGQAAATAVKEETVPVNTEKNTSRMPVTEGTPINAPLSGSILEIKVKPGETVKQGQVLLTLEALKMENEIVAPVAGVVKGVYVQTGAMVNVGDVLVVLG
ncbi:MAG: biotin/lipoyl-binding protein [Firmicutes bacterium]|nr:biotin/lipoyl-binding protein [Bacillota bacterium]